MLELRIRACHVTGSFTAKSNRASAQSGLTPAETPANFDYGRLSHPPSTFLHEKLKVEQRLPAAQAFAREHKPNEFFDGDLKDVGIIVLGGLYNTVSRALARLGLADAFGNARVPIYCLNLAYPLIPEEVKAFCVGKKHVLIVEEGSPEFVEQAIATELRRADIQTRIHGKGALPKAGEYTGEVMLRGLANFLSAAKPAGIDSADIAATTDRLVGHKPAAVAGLARRPTRRHSRRPPPPRRARRTSAPAARSGRCSPRSSSLSARSAARTSRPISAAIRSRPSRRSRWATRSSATVCRSPPPRP